MSVMSLISSTTPPRTQLPASGSLTQLLSRSFVMFFLILWMPGGQRGVPEHKWGLTLRSPSRIPLGFTPPLSSFSHCLSLALILSQEEY